MTATVKRVKDGIRSDIEESGNTIYLIVTSKWLNLLTGECNEH